MTAAYVKCFSAARACKLPKAIMSKGNSQQQQLRGRGEKKKDGKVAIALLIHIHQLTFAGQLLPKVIQDYRHLMFQLKIPPLLSKYLTRRAIFIYTLGLITPTSLGLSPQIQGYL